MRTSFTRIRPLLLLTTTVIAASALACGGGDDGADPTPMVSGGVTGDAAETAELTREQLEPLMAKAHLRPEDIPGTWQMRDFGLMAGDTLAANGGQQTLMAQAIMDMCLVPGLEGGGGPDAGVIRTFVAEATLSSVISTVSRAGESAARSVEALRQPVTNDTHECVRTEVNKQLGGIPITTLNIGELRSVSEAPDGTGANVVAMTLGTGGSAFTQHIVTAAAARDGLLATSVEVTLVAGSDSPTPPLAPERLAEITQQRLEEALTSR